MKLKFVCASLFVFLGVQSTFGQLTELEIHEMAKSENQNELVSKASALTQDGYLYYAEILVDRLLELNGQSSNYHYRKAFLVMEIRRDYAGAIPHFQTAILDMDSNFDMYSAKEKSAPTDALYYLAYCYHLNEQLDLAVEFYSKFKEESNKKSELIPVADIRIAQCEEAKRQIASPVNVQITNIGNPINSAYPEYSPVISLDGSALYFTSRRPWANNETQIYKDPAINQYPEDVYVSYQDFDGGWTDPVRLEFCKPRQNEATIAISSDERKIYIYEDSTGNGDIFYTDFYRAKFQDIELLDVKNINTRHWETHAMMSHDKTMFFFVSDRPGGLGGRDIYVVELDDEGNWGKPKNLGPNVNSEHDEDAPFIAVDDRTLYFATNGIRSIGGFDIMKTELQDDGTWSPAVNLGYPFNSTNDDIFYTTTLDGRKGYMTSFRSGGLGEKDIYEIHNDYLGVRDVAVLKGLIKTLDDKPIPEEFAINVKLVCIDCEEGNKDRFIYPRLRDGVFMTGLEPCRTYRLEYTNLTDDKQLGDDTFTTLCDTNYQEIYREMLLDVDTRTIVIPPDTLILDTVVVADCEPQEFMHYFAYNKNKLSTKRGDLKKFVRNVEDQLNDGCERVTINVYSSASHVPTKTYKTNENLTKIRAENMKYDLIAHFEQFVEFKGRVNVVIVSAVVQGPTYVQDAVNKEKYFPYQYVGMKTE